MLEDDKYLGNTFISRVNMMKNTIYLILIAVLPLTGCDNDKTQPESIEEHAEEMHAEGMHAEDLHEDAGDHEQHDDSRMGEGGIDATTPHDASLASIVDGYLEIKKALKADNKDGAAAGGKALITAFNDYDMTKLTKDNHEEYMEIVENAKEHAEHIVKSALAHQKEHFEELSTDINDLIALMGQ